MIEYTGQVLDGPETGNLISSTRESWQYMMFTSMALDGPDSEPSRMLIAGSYGWSNERGGWIWTPQGRPRTGADATRFL